MDKEAVKLNWPGRITDIDGGGLAVDPKSGDVTGNADAGVLRYRVRECW